MSKMSITNLLLEPESKTLEFKRNTSSLAPILKTVIAFANTAGGTVIIGQDDTDVLVNLSLNERQLWFLEELEKKQKLKALDITRHWKVSAITAKRDLIWLQEHNLIKFIGNSRTGSYELITTEPINCPDIPPKEKA
jgi:predicted HTH transcriptional regulator